MTVRPFDLGTLARLPSTDAAANLIAARGRRLLLGKSRELKTAPFGFARVACTDVAAPLVPDEGDAIWVLSKGNDPRRGFVILDGLAALRLVAATLGIPAPFVHRPLGASERGIVAATIASALRSAGSDLSVLIGEKQWRPGGLVRVALVVDFRSFEERARLDVPSDWLPFSDDADDNWWLAQANERGLPIPFSLQLARTSLTARDWSRACVGDAIVFDAEPSPHRNADWCAWLVSGDYCAEILLSLQGQATMVSAFQRRSRSRAPGQVQPAIRAATQEEASAMTEANARMADVTMLASAPVELVAEIGKIVMRADEVAALEVGSVLTLGFLRPNIVELRIADRTWAEGELVDVDGQLGVRLTAVASVMSAARDAPRDGADTQR